MCTDGADQRVTGPIDRRGLALLLVDDDTAFLRTLQILLEDEARFDVLTACSVERALEILLQRRDVRVVISDVSMPHRSGFDLCETVRRLYPGVRVYLMSAHRLAASDQAVLAAGAARCFSKPINPAELLEELSTCADPQ